MNKTSHIRVKPRAGACCPIVELRQYTLHPGQRDVLIELFDREFVESQEALGMTVIGQFRDLDHPDRFVWLRGFPDMRSRARALSAFYGGPVWEAHGDAANATMSDSDNVLLLRPARPASGFSLRHTARPPTGSMTPLPGLITATIYSLEADDDDFAEFFERTLRPELTQAGASILACLVTESSPNNYPALPVREGENTFVCFALFRDYAAYQFFSAGLAGSLEWRSRISPALAERIMGPPQQLRLSPTARSQLHG